MIVVLAVVAVLRERLKLLIVLVLLLRLLRGTECSSTIVAAVHQIDCRQLSLLLRAKPQYSIHDAISLVTSQTLGSSSTQAYDLHCP
jgi:hypothetical protein